MIALVACAGVAGLGQLGDAFGREVAGAGGVQRRPTGLAVSSQAGAFSGAVELAETASHVADDVNRVTPRVHVYVSNDWDVPNHAAETFRLQEQLHARHPALKVTQFVGPYTFTDPAVPASVAGDNVAWLRRMEREHGDEIGLHIHPNSHFVASAGVTPKRGPTFGVPRAERDFGYTVNLGAAYDEGETVKVLTRAKEIFAEHGLPDPTAFRAGGWTADTHTLRALAAMGFRSDSSAVAYEFLDHWRLRPEHGLYKWVESHWRGTHAGSQPYFPAADNAAVPGSLPILEIPDNGALADYATADDMKRVFHQTADAPSTGKPRVLSIGYHGVSLPNFYDRIDGALTYLDEFTQPNNIAEVVYVTAREIADLFSPAP